MLKASAIVNYSQQRSQILKSTRAFFADRHVIEVITPVIHRYATTDPYIESFGVTAVGGGVTEGFLQTSPEWGMKQLIGSGVGDCYQIATSFRYGEQGLWHHPEFLLLEWYRLHWNITELAEEVHALLSELGISSPMLSLSFAELCTQAGLIDVHQADTSSITETLIKAGIRWQGKLDFRGLRDLFWQTCVQPILASMPLVCVNGFPEDEAVFAAFGEDGLPLRFEIYAHGLELANGGEELRDTAIMRARIAADCAYRHVVGRYVPTPNESYLQTIEQLPPVSGVAVGLDRVTALVLGVGSLDGISRLI